MSSVKVNLKALQDLIPEIKKNFSRELKQEIEVEILEEIVKGKSPVKGKKFKDYSSKYAEKKGYRRPVDMTVSGKMLNSLKAKQKPDGVVELEFKSKIAGYHNNGEGRLPERRLLPTKRGETFKPSIMNKIKAILQKAIKKAIK